MSQTQILGLLRCQADSYVRSLETHVASCTRAAKGDKWEVEFQDTVLFPEGGGQPADHGTITPLNNGSGNNGSSEDSGERVKDPISVSDVQRRGLKAIHMLSNNLPVGTRVRLDVNWARRWDHMQQHTGQHLLSAVLEKVYGLDTLSWGMNSRHNSPNHIELPRKLSLDEVDKAQSEVSYWISRAEPISMTNAGTIDPEKGQLRIINIGGLDDHNACCGTHLQHTSDIGSIILLHQQPIRGTNSRLFFFSGDRALAYARQTHDMLRSLSLQMACQPADLESRITQLSTRLSSHQKQLKQTQSELAKYEAKAITAQGGGLVHKTDAECADYIKLLGREIDPSSLTMPLILVSGSAGTPGAVMVLGSSGEQVSDSVERLRQCVSELKGGGRGITWQGKVSRFQKGELETLSRVFG